MAVLTANYLQFFPAVQSLQTVAERQWVIRDLKTNLTQILLYLRVSNPTGYTGFKVESANIQLYFTSDTSSNASLFQKLKLFSPNPLNLPLGPRGMVPVNATFPLTGDQSSALAAFSSKYGASVISHYTVDVHLVTFLDALIGIEAVRDIQYPPG